MKAINPEKPVFYIPKCDRKKDTEEQTVFEVKLLTGKENAELRDDLYEVTGSGKQRKESLRSGTVELRALTTGLKGWKNFKNDDDIDLSFDSTKMDKMIDLIPPEVRTELSDFIRGESSLSESD